jgi:hypothetical protein
VRASNHATLGIRLVHPHPLFDFELINQNTNQTLCLYRAPTCSCFVPIVNIHELAGRDVLVISPKFSQRSGRYRSFGANRMVGQRRLPMQWGEIDHTKM